MIFVIKDFIQLRQIYATLPACRFNMVKLSYSFFYLNASLMAKFPTQIILMDPGLAFLFQSHSSP